MQIKYANYYSHFSCTHHTHKHIFIGRNYHLLLNIWTLPTPNVTFKSIARCLHGLQTHGYTYTSKPENCLAENIPVFMSMNIFCLSQKSATDSFTINFFQLILKTTTFSKMNIQHRTKHFISGSWFDGIKLLFLHLCFHHVPVFL